jgi:hypothetical protein
MNSEQRFGTPWSVHDGACRAPPSASAVPNEGSKRTPAQGSTSAGPGHHERPGPSVLAITMQSEGSLAVTTSSGCTHSRAGQGSTRNSSHSAAVKFRVTRSRAISTSSAGSSVKILAAPGPPHTQLRQSNRPAHLESACSRESGTVGRRPESGAFRPNSLQRFCYERRQSPNAGHQRTLRRVRASARIKPPNRGRCVRPAVPGVSRSGWPGWRWWQPGIGL